MFLPLEDSDVILIDDIVALVRSGGRTIITSYDNSVRESVFTPVTLDRRSLRVIGTAADITRRTQMLRMEDN